ncbi:MAG: ABC transporter ATP-binding protein [Candidatus Uhrbacteria bacterium]|nr:ABC transporter ATP-binding protein [Candidatus Uhrbacteria bacterium]
MSRTQKPKDPNAAPSVFTVLGPYRSFVIWLIVLGILPNILTLFLPKIISAGVDAYVKGDLNLPLLALEFGLSTLGIFVLSSIQSAVQVYASEKVGRDLRSKLVQKISHQGYRFIEEKNPSKLLTNITSDIDSIKMFVSLVIVSLVSSAVIIVGATILLLMTNWRLALVVLTLIPLIGATFFFIFKQVRTLFTESREIIDWLNKVINESILGAALIRVLHSGNVEHEKFTQANSQARMVGIRILKLFSLMIPIITFVSSMATLAVLTLGGYFVVNGTMSIGSFTAFMSYIVLLIFPILILGFMSNIIAQASASYARIYETLRASDEVDVGRITESLHGKIEVKDLTMLYGEKYALKDVSLEIAPGTKTAIIGPTAAGKTQLLNVMAGLATPTFGEVLYEGHPLSSYAHASFYPQIGLVFQDSVLFQTTMRENIAFSTTVTDESLEKAIETAELTDFLLSLPHGLDTIVSERGTSLSGGQKQRLMLARALALNPKILFLDDFTARVDAQTEHKILANIEKNYPGMTLISITQKIAPIEQYDQIILLMEGEILARGTHKALMHASPEYVQIFDSQRSTNVYELRT